MQFSWAAPAEVERIRSLAKEMGISYRHVLVHRKPSAAAGAIRSIVKGRKAIKKIPAGTCHKLPDAPVNHAGHGGEPAEEMAAGQKAYPSFFDADGFPIQERVDFAGLKPGSLQYRWFKAC